MTNISVNMVALEIYKIVQLLKNYESGVDMTIGVDSDRFYQCVSFSTFDKSEHFKEYLYRNDEAALYLKIAGAPGELKAEHAKKLFKLSPDGYAEILRNRVRSDVTTDYMEMLDSHFEEVAPLAKAFIRDSYLPIRHLNNGKLILAMAKKQLEYAQYIVDDELLIEAVKDNPKVLSMKTSEYTSRVLLMRKLCKANPNCAKYACSPITTNAGVLRTDSKEEKMRKVNAWLEATAERKLISNASGGGLPRVKTVAAPKPKFKI